MSDKNSLPVVAVKKLHKSFKLPHEQHSGIKQRIINIFKGVKGYETQHVLNDISFEINKGEFFGIVGRNGCGKSTLLKLLAGIYVTDEGLVQVNGSLTPFIELGVGFNPELTGRENVFLNGSLLGFSKSEMTAMYDSIVEFAELEQFMDQKLKNYSSGMQVRLAFSIAIRANSDILLIDEVLAVGDASFQQKCNDYFEKQKASGQTIVLVTHDMASVEKYCSRAILIEDGKITLAGAPEKVADRYTDTNQRSIDKQITIDNMVDEHPDVETYVVNRNGDRINSTAVGDYIYLVMKWKGQGVENIGIGVNKQSGEIMYKTNTQYDKIIVKGKTTTCKLKMNLAPGKYYFRVRLYGKNDLDTKVMIENGPSIIVKPVRTHKFGGLVPLEHSWK